MINIRLKAAFFCMASITFLPTISFGSNLDCPGPMPTGTYVGHFETIIHRPDYDTTNLVFDTDTLNASSSNGKCVQFSKNDPMLNKTIMDAFLNHRDVTVTVGASHYITAIAYSINE